MCYFDNFIININKQSLKTDNQTVSSNANLEEKLINLNKRLQNQTSTTTTRSSLPFKWNHCGQTYYNPSINPHNLKRISKRIIGGEDAVKHSWPFLVSVRIKLNKSEHQCGGTLITDQHILTAAHCIFPYLHLAYKLSLNTAEIFSLIEVHVGINEHEKDPQSLTKDHVYLVENFDFHENFNFNEWILVNDIAIMKLKRKVNLNRPEVNVACLPTRSETDRIKVGENVVAIGWGAYAEEFNYTAYVFNQLQQAVFTVVDQDDKMCNTGMIGNRWDRNFTVCANDLDKKKVTCFGDSGGPVLAYRNKRWTLVGIISFAHDVRDFQTNKKKCNASMPFYFVNVEAYIDWINKKVEATSLSKFQK